MTEALEAESNWRRRFLTGGGVAAVPDEPEAPRPLES